MRLMNERQIVRDVIRHYTDTAIKLNLRIDKKIVKAMAALDPETASALDVSEILGNEYAVAPMYCDSCFKASYNLIEVSSGDGDYSGVLVCGDCLRKALRLIEEAK